MKKIALAIFLLLSACAFAPPIAKELVGRDQTYIVKRLGQPVVKRTEEPYRLWSYRTGSCTTLIYFDDSNTVRAVDFSGSCS